MLHVFALGKLDKFLDELLAFVISRMSFSCEDELHRTVVVMQQFQQTLTVTQQQSSAFVSCKTSGKTDSEYIRLKQGGAAAVAGAFPFDQIPEIILRPAAGVADKRLTAEFVGHPQFFIGDSLKSGTQRCHIRILRPGVDQVTVKKFTYPA